MQLQFSPILHGMLYAQQPELLKRRFWKCLAIRTNGNF